MRSVLRDWVMELPLREQGSLLGAIRGCDTAMKNDSCKKVTRAFRYEILNPADEREVVIPGAYMSSELPDDIKLSQWDCYPIHWVTHMFHAIEILAYRHPDDSHATYWYLVYTHLCRDLHLSSESRTAMIIRLSEDRIEKGNVVS